MELVQPIFILLALVAGTMLGFFIQRRSSASIVEQITRQSEEWKSKAEQVQQDFIVLSAQRAQLEEALKQQTEQAAELRQFKAEEAQAMEERFQNLANKLLKESTTEMRTQHEAQLTQLLTPFREQISQFEKKVEETHKEDIREATALKSEIRMLQELNQNISKEAHNLTQALKGQSKTRGNWGEMILEHILEKSGLIKDQEYIVQQSYTGDSGNRLQPDVVINLPEEKHLIIDSKVSLTAYERYSNAEEETQRDQALKEHLASVRRHIKELSEKKYEQIYGLKSLDFVMMFIPVEPAFNVAVSHDPDLYTDAFNKNIILISNATLLASLRTISSIWRQEKQNRNALKIAEEGGKMYDKLADFLKSLEEMGKRIDQLQEAYDKSMKQLGSGRGNLLSRAEKMKSLGARTTKQISLSEEEEEGEE